MSDRINAHYSAKVDKADWSFRISFRTEVHDFDDVYKEQAVYDQLDKWLQEIKTFEDDLMEKPGKG